MSRTRFAAIVGDDHVRDGGPADTIRGVTPGLVVEPGDERELADVLRAANDSGLAVVPRGGGTKLEWGNPPSRADVLLSSRRLDHVIDHAWADLTVTVEAGCTMAALQDTLRAHRQRVAVDALWSERATVGGILASNDSGALRLRFGGLRDLIIGITIALADGTLATSGGRVVKNVAGYDLPKLSTGALGTLGVITRAIFRLHPLPRQSRTFSISAEDLVSAQRMLEAIQDSGLSQTALQLRVAGSDAPVIDVLFEGSEAGIAAQFAHLQALTGAVPITEPRLDVWGAREDLWSGGRQDMILKLSVPMTEISSAIARVRELTGTSVDHSRLVMYATGLGWAAVPSGPPGTSRALVEALRDWALARGGSVVILRPAEGAESLDSWGSFGDAAPLMQEVRRQFDPKGTVNPGRFIDPSITQ